MIGGDSFIEDMPCHICGRDDDGCACYPESGDTVESVADGSRESVGSAPGSVPDGGYVCDECGQAGDGHAPGCVWGTTS